jgi:hypothetical protein
VPNFSIPDNIPGVVVDATAGLMWTAEDVSEKQLDHADATAAAQACRIGGFEDWRMPTVEELFLLADRSKYRPAIDKAFFPSCKSDWYWTASPDASVPDCAWVVGFGYGSASLGGRGRRCCVRAVRSVARPSQ